MKGKRIGYTRVSTLDQNTSRQLEGIEIDVPYVDHASGKDANRPQLQALLKNVREGDQIFVHSLDRLARNLGDLRNLVREITSKGATIQFTKENLKFSAQKSDHISELLLNMLGAFAEFERSLIKERQSEGIAIAKAKGKYRGGTPKLSPDQVTDLRARAEQGVPKAKIARAFGISRETVYQYLKIETVISC
jgi:DNA invertase Pin-like site-specific DNA recombinase